MRVEQGTEVMVAGCSHAQGAGLNRQGKRDFESERDSESEREDQREWKRCAEMRGMTVGEGWPEFKQRR